MTQNTKSTRTQKMQMSFFFTNLKSQKPEMEIFAFCAIILTQNDCLNHSFVKDEHTYGQKWPKMAKNIGFNQDSN